MPNAGSRIPARISTCATSVLWRGQTSSGAEQEGTPEWGAATFNTSSQAEQIYGQRENFDWDASPKAIPDEGPGPASDRNPTRRDSSVFESDSSIEPTAKPGSAPQEQRHRPIRHRPTMPGGRTSGTARPSASAEDRQAVDMKLLLGVVAGDRLAYAAFYDRHAPRILGIRPGPFATA